MADFFRGLQGGFQTGMQLGQAMRQRRMEEELSKAYGLTPQEQLAAQATPEQLARAQAEAQAMQQQDAAEFGLTPQESARYAPAAPQEGARVALPTYTMGGQTFQRAPTQQEIDSARMRAAADVYGRFGDAARREELMRGLRAEERATTAEARAQKSFETQQEEAGLRIGETRRQITERENYNNFAKFATDNPNLPVDELRKAARTQFNLTPKQEEDYILSRLNIQKADADAFKLNIQKKLQGKNLTQLGQLYNTDPDFDDKTDLAIVPGKGGAVTLNFIDKASGRVTSTQSFKSEALATEYLAKQAIDPLNIGTWLQTVQKNEAVIEQSQAYASRLRALGGEEKGLEKKISDAEKTLGRKLTDDERKILVGLAPRPRDVSNADVISYAKELVGKPTGRLVDGKPERYTETTAVPAARAILEQQPTTTGLPGWGEGGQKTSAATTTAAPTAAPARAAIDPLGLQIDRETEELALGRRTAFSPEVQAALDARGAGRRESEQAYLAREQNLATGRGLWR